MFRRESVIDYALARRALLADLRAGRASSTDACDAHPYLLRAARYHGVSTATPCPLCRREALSEVTYAYGDALRDTAGRARSAAELEQLAEQHGSVDVYAVEVCQGCGWNHLRTSYRLRSEPAQQQPPSEPRRRRARS